MIPTPSDLALTEAALTIPGLEAVAIGGSRAAGLADAASDTDAYAFYRGTPGTPALRHTALARIADAGQVKESDAFGLECHLSQQGRPVELVFLDLAELESLLDRAFGEGLDDPAYPTAFLYTVANCVPTADSGVLARIKARLEVYPVATRSRLLKVLPEFLDTYLGQIRSSQRRGDLPAVAHRVGHLVDTWFNLLFALNSRLQPGEKRLLVHAAKLPVQPARMVDRWDDALALGCDDPGLPGLLDGLVGDLLELAHSTPETPKTSGDPS